LLLIALFLSGCATYKFHHGKAPYDKGYVVSRDDYAIPEYTLGKDNKVPPLKVAKERFKRRRRVVEDYYKKMGFIENHFKTAVYEPPVTLLKMVGGIVRLPYIALSDYRYEHNPKYKERVKQNDAKQDDREAKRIASLKEKLNEYLVKDLAKEKPTVEEPVIEETSMPEPVTEQPATSPEVEPLAAEPITPTVETPTVEIPTVEKTLEPIPPAVEKTAEEPAYPAEPVKVEEAPAPEIKPLAQETEAITPAPEKEEKPVVVKEKAQKQKPQKQKPPKKEKPAIKGDLKVAITAKPLKGYSPLKVQFDGRKSSSPYGKIISYNWEFGDADISTKPKPVNTYFSTTFGSRYFTATLTVKDDKGNTANSSVEIEVITK